MKRKIKTISVFFIALFAVSLVATSCASSKKGAKRNTTENVIQKVEADVHVA